MQLMDPYFGRLDIGIKSNNLYRLYLSPLIVLHTKQRYVYHHENEIVFKRHSSKIKAHVFIIIKIKLIGNHSLHMSLWIIK